jgi:signal transduction histidine kinase/HAMP domain-containing protein
MRRLSLRTKILMAVLAAVLATDGLATWAVNDRLLAGARQEADSQAQAQMAQTRALLAERAATLAFEGEAVALYPAVITALVDGNPKPLLVWSGQVSASQSIRVTVVDADGRVVARGHAPDQAGDNLASQLAGLRLALGGQTARGTEQGDEIGLAVRGYAPVRRNGREGDVVGAVMIADPVAEPLLRRISAAGVGSYPGSSLQLEGAAPTRATDAAVCSAPAGSAAATCQFPMLSPDGQPSATMSVTVPLTDIARALDEAQRSLWLVGALVFVLGAAAAWWLARSLTGPLAQLTTAAGRIAGGAYDRPVAARGSDEIGVLAGAFETMRQQVAAATTHLRDERDVLDAVLESTDDAILMADPAGQPVVANRRWTALLGSPDLNAAADLRRLEGDYQQTFAEAAATWLADPERMAAAEFERTTPTYQRMRCYTAPVRHRNGIPIGRIFVLRDVTRESEAERMRSALVATVSHELRSPLTAIAGYTQTLLHSGPWDANTEREFLEIIASSAAKLAGLIDNLLDAAKVEAGVLHLEREPVKVERIAEQVVAQRRPLAANHSLQIQAAPEVPLAHADPVRVEQVLANLVDNALKYSPNGGPITVRINGGAEELTIGVSDHGVGITPDQSERLFERFYRVDSTLTRSTRGVGLGLFICRSLVEAQGGRIWVESEPGQGSTFWFTLPVFAEVAEVASPPRARALREVIA